LRNVVEIESPRANAARFEIETEFIGQLANDALQR